MLADDDALVGTVIDPDSQMNVQNAPPPTLSTHCMASMSETEITGGRLCLISKLDSASPKFTLRYIVFFNVVSA